MAIESTTQFPSKKRTTVAHIDDRIDTAHHSIGEQFSSIKESLSSSEVDLFYDEPSYSADVLLELPELPASSATKEALLAATDELVEAHNVRRDYVGSLSLIEQALFSPVDDFSLARSIKDTYRDIKIDAEHPLHDEPLVSIRDYGIAGQAYYSRKNGATGDPVPGVSPDVYVRKSMIDNILLLNRLLDTPEVTEYYGKPVEVFVEEGWRDPALQGYLYETVIPSLIRKELIEEGLDTTLSPEDFEARVTTERNKKIARPPLNEDDSPPPHATGAAFDFAIREKQDSLDIVYDVNVPMGRRVAQMVKRTDPDYFEHHPPQDQEDHEARQNRRAQHALLKMAGLVQNPSEFWHASKGDQLSSVVTNDEPHYGWAPHSNKK